MTYEDIDCFLTVMGLLGMSNGCTAENIVYMVYSVIPQTEQSSRN